MADDPESVADSQEHYWFVWKKPAGRIPAICWSKRKQRPCVSERTHFAASLHSGSAGTQLRTVPLVQAVRRRDQKIRLARRHKAMWLQLQPDDFTNYRAHY